MNQNPSIVQSQTQSGVTDFKINTSNNNQRAFKVKSEDSPTTEDEVVSAKFIKLLTVYTQVRKGEIVIFENGRLFEIGREEKHVTPPDRGGIVGGRRVNVVSQSRQ